MMNKHKVVLVTGVSSGIGREIAHLLAEQGFRVFGTARNPRQFEAISGVELVRHYYQRVLSIMRCAA
jgi:NAD(P)-dependent dehydrogenase (short-subunit alcohol dehydrogenase family)